jgi:hypothetical protein
VDEIAMEIDSKRNSSAHGSMLDQICPTEVENDLNNKTLDETNKGEDIFTNQGENDLQVEHFKSYNENDNLGNATAEIIDFENASKFEHGTAMERHVKSVHLKIRSLTCQYCDKSFVTNQSVKMHIDAIHFLLRPFSCDFCEETFTQKSNLKTHVKNKHLSKKQQSFELEERADENDVTETFEESKNADEPIETGKNQVVIKKKLYPRIILKRLNVSLTHPFICTECQQRFHKVYEATHHVITTHQNSNYISLKKYKTNSLNRNKICRCESGKRKVRCKKCERCLAQKCNQCKFCLKPSMKKACVKRKCLYQAIFKCQH